LTGPNGDDVPLDTSYSPVWLGAVSDNEPPGLLYSLPTEDVIGVYQGMT
jgi:hypothetical protein